MEKLTLEQWKVVLENLKDLDEDTIEEFGDTVEILWFDSSNDWALCHGYEVFEDGFKTEEEAQQRLNEVYKELNWTHY